ncbi:NUDIX domain-containing protein [Plesiomonas shigelloides]|uniref:8-oxo-dGTP diphosphatase n=1 Tax=Plesiomonas shigelloides TaxID=703 RepID=A0A8I1WC92_PLESH|nr:NUDIX domain-containing protein [Plesiomonas shigelloides]MBO1110152.1 NUDIX domain-containing protein [Plesiomonas shigelloides]
MGRCRIKKHIQVVASSLTFEDRYLAVHRGPAKLDDISRKWEVPGGKVEKGESREEAISRELEEELANTITDPKFISTAEHSYTDFDNTRHCCVVAVKSSEVTNREQRAQKW